MSSTTIGSLSVGPLCLGTNVFGRSVDSPAAARILDAFVEGGGDHVDTADLYGGGLSETYIGEWLAGRGKRDDVVIATKVGWPDNEVHRGLRPATIRAAVDDCLRRLRTDRIDLLYTHHDDESVSIPDIISTLDELVRAGKVREIAASNLSPERLTESMEFSAAEGKAAYVALQPHYSLMSRDTYEGPLADVAEKFDLAVFPYFSLAMGFLTGKHRPGVQADSARSAGVARYVDSERGRKVLAALDAIAARTGAEPASIALAWLSSRKQVAAPIASARKLEQLPALLAAASLKLTPAQLDALTVASA
ncbi:aldo/keto reductase [Kutzneria kofuensis]|uniref:Aryl-alcohol dehydrogenase-like predicted oxidoreductase n=1 Tax=Kutzneria kofuensis TaxID=103725 RepID=A0A7W9KM79_9PSEU|nr:aldo/keto reductase [Kutzneria kofuensis]MBB5895141.1 aryl-alcohol dehydrogenase-like predicted oxidoreductase [Kutzneria kofuensis]